MIQNGSKVTRRIYTTITNQAFYDLLKEDAEQDGATNWTINKNARPGDLVLLYVCAPTSAVVAIALVETKPELCEDPQNAWFRSYFCEMSNLVMLRTPMTRKDLMDEFPIWRYWTQPRNSSRVPDVFVNRLTRLIEARVKK